MKKKDIVIILIIIIIALASIFIINQIKSQTSDTKLIVYANGIIEKEVLLNEETNAKFTIKTDKGYNRIEIKDGYVSMYEADCPDQICVYASPIDEIGEMIVCLPHQLIVEIVPIDYNGDINE